MPRIILLTALAIGGLATRSAAQLVVQGVRDLDFGSVMSGVSTTVAATDPIRSGQFYLGAPAVGTRVQIRFILPSVLSSSAGDQMPIAFRNSDGLIQEIGPSAAPAAFNPRATLNYQLQSGSAANIWLGGSVSPTATQPAGAYTAPVVITVTVF